MSRFTILVALCFGVLASSCCQAQWTKVIACPKGAVYRDVRKDAGRSESCRLLLPGGLGVQDGPSRDWYSPDFLGRVGNYDRGRQRGHWKECDRFGRCGETDYPSLWPAEKQRPGVKDEIPVTYLDGKFVFDFSSCRATSLVYAKQGQPDRYLSLRMNPDACFYTYSTSDQLDQSDALVSCTIPFQTGKVAFSSLDLMQELPKASLPQYCRLFIPPAAGPTSRNLKPSNLSGDAEIFTAEFDLGNDDVGIAQARLHFQKNAASRADRCVVRYDPPTKAFYLLSDQMGKWLGPLAKQGDAPLANKECLLASCSSASVTAKTLAVRFAIRFNPATFAGEHRVFQELVGTKGEIPPTADWGNWTVPHLDVEPANLAWPSDHNCPAGSLSQ